MFVDESNGDEEEENGESPGILRYLTKERQAQIISLSKKPDLYERLSAAIAPSIYENEDVKKGILLQVKTFLPIENRKAVWTLCILQTLFCNLAVFRIQV